VKSDNQIVEIGKGLTGFTGFRGGLVREPFVYEIGSGMWEINFGRAGVDGSLFPFLCQRAAL
jgi:hypothetical protein